MRSRRPALEDSRVVLDPVAEAELLHHLEVVLGALAEPMRLEHLPLGLQLLDPLVQLVADLADGALDRRLRRHVLGRRPDRDVVELREDLAADRVEVRDLLHLVPEERDAVRGLLVRRLDLDDVAPDSEPAAAEHGVVADVLAVDQLAQDEVAVVLLADVEDQHALAPLLRRAEAVDAGDGGDDDSVAAREERGRRLQPEPRDVVVLGRVLLDVEVGLRDVGLGLVVVVVRDEVLDRVRGEELAELVAELRGKRLVVRDHERRALKLLDDPGHRRRLAGAGRAEQGLELVAPPHALGELLDRLRLVTDRPVRVGCLEGCGHEDRLATRPRPNGQAPVGEREQIGQRGAHLAGVRPDRAVVARREDRVAVLTELRAPDGPDVAVQE